MAGLRKALVFAGSGEIHHRLFAAVHIDLHVVFVHRQPERIGFAGFQPFHLFDGDGLVKLIGDFNGVFQQPDLITLVVLFPDVEKQGRRLAVAAAAGNVRRKVHIELFRQFLQQHCRAGGHAVAGKIQAVVDELGCGAVAAHTELPFVPRGVFSEIIGVKQTIRHIRLNRHFLTP